MKNILENAKDFKIIPNNFKSSGEFEIEEISDNDFKVRLILLSDDEANDYTPQSTIEIFGVNNIGLIYFETTILKRNDKILTLAMPQDYSVIQRREYSRVKLSHGKLLFKDLADNTVKEIEDISAGGIKFICSQNLSIDKTYDVEIALSNNMKIECGLQPIRVSEYQNDYMISAKFTNLENVDRVVLVQYAFKIKMEDRTKGD